MAPRFVPSLNPPAGGGEDFFMANLFLNVKLGNYQEQELDLKISAFEIFKRLYPYFQNVFLLESLGEDGKFNRYSYLGFEPILTICAKNDELFVNGRRHKTKNPYEEIAKLPKIKNRDLGYCGGLVGYITYEAARYFEPAFTGHGEREFPDFEFGFYTDGLKFDKKTRRIVYFHHGRSRLGRFLKFISQTGKLGDFDYKKIGELDTETHKKMVKEALEQIRKGNIFQVVLSLKSYFRITGDKRRIYAALRQINPSPYMFYFKFKDREVITASPELLINVRDKTIEHFGTLAGTIRRGKIGKEDQILAEELLSNEKEKAEHLMLVDLARNDLGKICKFKSIRVGKLMAVRKQKFVMHLITEIRGQLRYGEDVFSALSACFPAGTLSGAPKIEAMKIISSLENLPRGPYGGVGGYFSLDGSAMQAITIRSIFISGDNAYTQTGSGIVLDSSAEKEFEEILNKQKGMEEALRIASQVQKSKFKYQKKQSKN